MTTEELQTASIADIRKAFEEEIDESDEQASILWGILESVMLDNSLYIHYDAKSRAKTAKQSESVISVDELTRQIFRNEFEHLVVPAR